MPPFDSNDAYYLARIYRYFAGMAYVSPDIKRLRDGAHLYHQTGIKYTVKQVSTYQDSLEWKSDSLTALLLGSFHGRTSFKHQIPNTNNDITI